MSVDTEDLGSYVMSVLTGTLMGRAMTADDVCAGIVANGWAKDTPDLRVAVASKLDRLLVDRVLRHVGGERFEFSPTTIASLFGDDRTEDAA